MISNVKASSVSLKIVPSDHMISPFRFLLRATHTPASSMAVLYRWKTTRFLITYVLVVTSYISFIIFSVDKNNTHTHDNDTEN